jgi:AcrR family transcriptional regulator
MTRTSVPPDEQSSRRTTKGSRTRGRLLTAAEEVFLAHGYHEASIVKITEAAGVAGGTFYLYFSGKRQIFDELVEDLNRRVRHAMVSASGKEKTRAAAERAGFAAFFRFTAEHPALYRVVRQAEQVSPGVMRLHYQRLLEGYVEGLSAAMDNGEIVRADPEVMAWALMGIGEMIGMRWVLWEGGDCPAAVPDEVFDEVIGFVYRATGVREATP